MKRVLPLLAIVTVLALLIYPRPAPLSAPYTEIAAPTYRTHIGAPQYVTPTSTATGRVEASASAAVGGAPHPSGGIGNPATFWKPGYKPRPTPRVVVSKAVTGDATYYCRPGISRCTRDHPFGMYAAAGPEVRAMLGPDWRGQFVIVTDETGRGVVVQLIDWCACSGSHVIDLYWTAYQGMVNPVTVKEEP